MMKGNRLNMERDENERNQYDKEKEETKKWREYFRNSKDREVSKLLIKFLEIEKIKPGKAIDLGCGICPDTEELLKNGWEVIGIDKQDVGEEIFYSLKQDERKNFRFQKQSIMD